MRRAALSTLLGLAVWAVMAGANLGAPALTEAAEPPQAPLPRAVSAIEGVPSEALPPSGQCRIFFDHVRIDKEPPAMECEHARWLARSWGGRLVAVNGANATLVGVFKGRDDFRGVPAEALPPPGYCRAWLEGVALEQQPAYSDCVAARRIALRRGGRVLFMPL
jgi:hypothetical protein